MLRQTGLPRVFEDPRTAPNIHSISPKDYDSSNDFELSCFWGLKSLFQKWCWFLTAYQCLLKSVDPPLLAIQARHQVYYLFVALIIDFLDRAEAKFQSFITRMLSSIRRRLCNNFRFCIILESTAFTYNIITGALMFYRVYELLLKLKYLLIHGA